MENQPSVKLLTIKEAAQLTRLHPNTIRNLIQRNELKADRIGRSIRINELQLLSLLTPYEGGGVRCLEEERYRFLSSNSIHYLETRVSRFAGLLVTSQRIPMSEWSALSHQFPLDALSKPGWITSGIAVI